MGKAGQSRIVLMTMTHRVKPRPSALISSSDDWYCRGSSGGRECNGSSGTGRTFEINPRSTTG